MQMFTDATYARVAAEKRSGSAGLIMCGSDCVSWFSKAQKCATLSKTKDEYLELADVS